MLQTLGLGAISHLLDILDALDDVVPLNSFFDGVSIAQDGQVLFQSLLDQSGWKGGQMGQVPQHLQHLISSQIKSKNQKSHGRTNIQNSLI